MTSFLIGQKTAQHTQIIDPSHQPVIRAMLVVPDNDVLPFGTLVAVDANGQIVAWDGAAGVPKGVLTEDCDTGNEGVARVLVHGIVVKEHLKVGGNAISTEQLAELEDAGIWAN